MIHPRFRRLHNIEDKPCSKHSFHNTHDACLYVCVRPPDRNYLWRQSAVSYAIYENNNISAGPWPTPMSRFIALDWRWIYNDCSINSLKRFRFVIINGLNRIHVLKNVRGIRWILKPTLSVARNVFKEAIICFRRLLID